MKRTSVNINVPILLFKLLLYLQTLRPHVIKALGAGESQQLTRKENVSSSADFLWQLEALLKDEDAAVRAKTCELLHLVSNHAAGR